MNDPSIARNVYSRVEADPAFTGLVARRNRFASTLTVIVLAAYYAFMAVVAFAPQLFAVKLFEGGALTIGVPIGAVLIVGSWLLTGWYVHRANGEFDQITQQLKERHS